MLDRLEEQVRCPVRSGRLRGHRGRIPKRADISLPAALLNGPSGLDLPNRQRRRGPREKPVASQRSLATRGSELHPYPACARRGAPWAVGPPGHIVIKPPATSTMPPNTPGTGD